jgi:hypothetical protein
MKKITQFAGTLALVVLTLTATGQSKTGADYFEGTWNVLLKGVPGGDAKMFIVLEKKDTTMSGVVQDSTGKEMSKIDKVDLSGDTVTVYFVAQEYDVNLAMTKKDDDHVTGSLMGMFDAEGERVKK